MVTSPPGLVKDQTFYVFFSDPFHKVQEDRESVNRCRPFQIVVKLVATSSVVIINQGYYFHLQIFRLRIIW